MPNPEDITDKLGQLSDKKLPPVAPSTAKMVKPKLNPRAMAFDPFFIGVWVLTLTAIAAQFVLPVVLR
jgi:hypothetical protein